MRAEIWVVSPFECPDVGLAIAAEAAGAFPVIPLGRDRDRAEAALAALDRQLKEPFGVCLIDDRLVDLPLPDSVSKIILPWGNRLPEKSKAEPVWQVHSEKEMRAALKQKPQALILKGSEGAGLCGTLSNFMLFQEYRKLFGDKTPDVYIQGGVGPHTGAAYLSLGARGLVLDSQVALLPEAGTPAGLRSALERLNGSEIRTRDNYRYFVDPASPDPGRDVGSDELLGRLAEGPEGGVVALGQDVILADDFARRYKRLKSLVRAMRQAAFTDVRLAKSQDILGTEGALARDLGTEYALTQGPMARISDVPEFLHEVADAGALPFLAMSMMVGTSAEKALTKTSALLEDKPWGVGILGFTYPKILAEQTELIIAAKPPVVLIAGGRPTQAKPFEKAGIKVFLHVPAAGILDLCLKEGSRNFIFEGRESGGHVGPLFSTVLWEKQLDRLMVVGDPGNLRVLFAGGLHDAFSAAFVRIMAAPLAARGAKVGLQLGTVYLSTDEIVQSGAITEEYRAQLIEKNETLLLRSGRGQETRAVPSAFTDFFAAEKERLQAEGLEFAEVLMKLEELNLGRLRIAAKGIERKGDDLVELTTEQQRERGLYMAGEVTALIDAPLTIAAVHGRITADSLSLLGTLETDEQPKPTTAAVEVAVVGMECIFPGARDLDEYWCNVVFGRDSIREVDPLRWNPALFFDPETDDSDFVPSKWGGFIDPVDFDALEFGITPQSLAAIEPVQLLSLLVAKRALEDAGYTDLSKVDLEDTSVIFGAQGAGELSAAYGSRSGLRQFFGELPQEAAALLPRLTEDSFPGVLSNVIAGRISNRLNTGGRNYTVDAACASSLAALDIAYGELASGKSNMVLLGGADLHNGINDFLMFASTYALSRKGHCSTFDVNADGIALGEGIGVLVLKRLDDAERDGNTIYAVIKGVGGSSDGKLLGLTAPGRDGQMRALERAYTAAGVLPSDVGLIEAHGTGTAVGDRTEFGALTDTFLTYGTLPGRTYLGSVKTQIGHTKCAAGVAGLIKAVLCVRHGLLPPTLHLDTPNDLYTPSSPFAFRTGKTGFWNEDERLAGVSAFGFGGTNFHTVLRNYDVQRPDYPLRAWPSELFVFRGASLEDARDLMRKVKELCLINDSLKLRDIAYSLAVYGEDEVQTVLVASSRDGLLARLDDALEGRKGEGVYPVEPLEGQVALLFPGQGSQGVDMAAELIVAFPRMRRLLTQHPKLAGSVFPKAAFTDAEKKTQTEAVTDTRVAQPSLGIIDLAIAELLREFGVEADMVAGHSYGELPALCYAGTIDPDDLVDLSVRRAEAILAALGEDPGRMVAVFSGAEDLTDPLKDETEVWAVNLNAPRQTVIAGASLAVEGFCEKLTQSSIGYKELKVAGAFHTPLLAAAEENFVAALKEVGIKKPKTTIWSNTTAEPYPQTAAAIRRRLGEHLVNPVRFVEEIEGMYEAGARIFIEAGPGGVLSGLVGKILKGKEHRTILTEQARSEGVSFFLDGLARYLACGKSLNLEKLFEGRGVGKLDIDAPEQYRKKGTVWKVDGLNATPEQGELPAHAGKATIAPLLSPGRLASAYPGVNVESVMMAYLDNMNAVIQDQRDVMLGYLGQPESIPRSTTAPRRPAFGAVAQPGEVEAIVAEPVSAPDDRPDILSMSTEQITDLVLEIVSEKTGYPTDMLGLDVDLESELSIDSIKKMEIIGGLRDRTVFPEGAEDMEESFERLISIKTVREIVGWLEELGTLASEDGAGRSSTFTGAKALEETVVLSSSREGSESIVRMSILESASMIGETDDAALEGKLFAITDDGIGLASGLAEELERRKAKARLITADLEDLSDFDGLILINAAASKNHYTISDLFSLIKRSDEARLQWVATFDDIPGALLRARKMTKAKLLEGFPGFIKTLHHEFPDKHLRAVSFLTAFEQAPFATLAADELSSKDRSPETFYRGAERLAYLPTIRETQPREGGEEGLALDAESTVIVFGGGQGITPVLLTGLAKRYPCHYLLVGRSDAEFIDEAYSALDGRDEIRNYLIEIEGMKKPKEIEAKVDTIFKSRQIASSLKLIEDAGATASYRSVDVTDSKALRAFLESVREERGSIDGLIHAAGILEDKLFRDKELESFKRVYSTKVSPLPVVLDELLDGLKLFVMFSSMSSAFGNAGQIDYAAGNSVFDIVAMILGRKKPALRTVAFNWGPWKGAGMVNAGLEEEFRKRGIAFLSLDGGGDFFVDELERGSETNVLAIAGFEQELAALIEKSLR